MKDKEELDEEIYLLVKAAMDSGISKDEFREFLERKQLENKNKQIRNKPPE